MSAFDVETFENMTIDQSNETESTPVPEGSYQAIVDKVRVKSIKIKNGPREGQEVPILEVIYQINDDEGKLKELLNRDKITSRQDIWLDVTEQGALAFGPNQNVSLGRLRDACGLNKPGKAFAFKMLEGQGPLQVQVVNDTYNDKVYDSIKSVGRVE